MVSMASERTALLTEHTAATAAQQIDPPRNTLRNDQIRHVLPIALAAACAIAATSATTIFAYASITCADPTHCNAHEQDRYSGTVAIASVVAEFCGIISISVLRRWTTSNPKFGLCFWLGCRGTGVAILASGGKTVELLRWHNLADYNMSGIVNKGTYAEN
jgi:hypothetical protein